MADQEKNFVYHLLSGWQQRLGRPLKKKESTANVNTQSSNHFKTRNLPMHPYPDEKTYKIQSLKNPVYNALWPNDQHSNNTTLEIPPIVFSPTVQIPNSLPSPVLTLPKRELSKEQLWELAFQEFPFPWCIVSEI